MSFKFPFAAGLCCVLLTACAPVATGMPGEPAGTRNLPGPVAEAGDADLPEMCDAADYRGLVGTNVAAATFPAGPELRVYGVNDIVTQEYIPTRTNIVYGEDGAILRAFCG